VDAEEIIRKGAVAFMVGKWPKVVQDFQVQGDLLPVDTVVMIAIVPVKQEAESRI